MLTIRDLAKTYPNGVQAPSDVPRTSRRLSEWRLRVHAGARDGNGKSSEAGVDPYPNWLVDRVSSDNRASDDRVTARSHDTQRRSAACVV